MEEAKRPLGGIASLTLGVVSPYGAAPLFPDEGVQLPLLEDRSTYVEATEFVGSCKSVKHTLHIYTPIDYTLPLSHFEGLTQGFMALVEFNSRDKILLGWSEKAASDRALRLVSCSSVSGEKPAARGYKEWLFESIDGEQKI